MDPRTERRDRDRVKYQRPITALCERVLLELPRAVPGITQAIREEISEYRAVALPDHIEHVREQQELVLRLLTEFRTPNETDLKRVEALGRLRAGQGLSLEALIGSFHIGNRELWMLLNHHATTDRYVLPEIATLMWESIGVVTSGLAVAHFSVAKAEHSRDLMLRQRLMDLLEAGVVDEESAEIARALGFDAAGGFVALRVDLAEEALGETGFPGAVQGVSLAVSRRGGHAVVLCQGVDSSDIVRAWRERYPTARIGVGLRRTGLDGAVVSIEDAALCTAALPPGQTLDFATDWWRAIASGDLERIAPLLDDVRSVGVANPHLIDTVVAFADSGFSVTGCARVLHIHANTVAYRLDRWRDLTNWDPRTYAGLTKTLLLTRLTS